jgi:hypothetical protein
MTQEEKAKAYDEVLNKLRYFMAQGVDPLITRADVQDFFPELKESEDERIRKGIIRNLEYLMDRAEGFVKDELKERIAWLEKQGEHKLQIEKLPFEMKTPEESLGISSDEYNKIVDECIYGDDKSTWGKPELKEREQKPADVRTTGYWHVEDAMKEVEEKAEAFTAAHQGENADEILAQMRGEKNSAWSEEDEKILGILIEGFEDYSEHDREWRKGLKIKECIKWLKSLRPQNTWKPSDKQMEALLSEVNGWTKGCPKQIVLESLYNDLMKLYGTDRKEETD